MARSLVGYVVQNGNGDAVNGATVTITKRLDASAALLYTNEADTASTGTNTVTTVNGTIPIWLEDGTYNLHIDNGITTVDVEYEANSGRQTWGTGISASAILEGAGNKWAIHSDSASTRHYWPIEDFTSSGVPIDSGNSGDGWTYVDYDITPTHGGHNLLVPPLTNPGAYLAGVRGTVVPRSLSNANSGNVYLFNLAIGIATLGHTDAGYYIETITYNTYRLPSYTFSNVSGPGIEFSVSVLAPNVGFQRGVNNNYDERAFAGVIDVINETTYPDYSDLRFDLSTSWGGMNLWATRVGGPDPRSLA